MFRRLILLLTISNAFAQFFNGIEGVTKHDGYISFYYDENQDKVFLQIDKLNHEFLYVNALSEGLGSNDIGLDRGQLGSGVVVKFIKAGNKESEQYRYLMYNVHSYIVKQEDFEDIKEWVEEHNFYQESIEDVGDNFDEDYLRAYPNSADDDCRVSSTRHRIHMQLQRKIPHEMLQTSVSYLNEGKSYDSSVLDYINIALPTKWLINQMNLRQSLIDGEWINKNGEIVFFDPTVNICSGASNEGVLVANKKLLLNWLEENGYVILWILNGEKDLRNSDSEKFDDIPFIGYGGVSGYAYLDGDEFIENIDVKIERPLGWVDD